MVEGEAVRIDEIIVLNMLDEFIFLFGIQLFWGIMLAHIVYDDSLVMMADLIQIVSIFSH